MTNVYERFLCDVPNYNVKNNNPGYFMANVNHSILLNNINNYVNISVKSLSTDSHNIGYYFYNNLNTQNTIMFNVNTDFNNIINNYHILYPCYLGFCMEYKNDIIYSNHKLNVNHKSNYLCDINGTKKSILFIDLLNSSQYITFFVLVFFHNNDIMSLYIKCETLITPNNLNSGINHDNYLVLSNLFLRNNTIDKPLMIDTSTLIFDKTGLYLSIPFHSMKYLLSLEYKPFNKIVQYTFKTEISLNDTLYITFSELLKNIINTDNILLNKNSLTIVTHINKYHIQQNMYILKYPFNQLCIGEYSKSKIIIEYSNTGSIKDNVVYKSINIDFIVC